MIYNLYTLYDSVAESFGSPSMASSDGVIIRDLEHLISLDTKFAHNAKDMRLFCIGTFDAISGDIMACNRRLVIDLKELVKEV